MANAALCYNVTEVLHFCKKGRCQDNVLFAGYFVYPKFWGKGYTTETFKRVLEFAFLDNDVYRVTTGCLAENVGSERVMQKCGLIKEAEHVDYEWHDGKMKTRLEYRLLKDEWRKHAN